MRKAIDLTGQKFGRLVVIERCENLGGKTAWLCVCDCGSRHKAAGSHLKSGYIKSCGCLAREHGSTVNLKHGKKGSPTYKTWLTMRQRCNNPNDSHYPRYGGRGIGVCSRWESFQSFYDDMGERPKGRSIDRIDADGDYTPSNCRWSDPKEQANNRRNTKYLTLNGETKALGVWAEETGQPIGRLKQRVRAGWSDEQVVLGK